MEKETETQRERDRQIERDTETERCRQRNRDTGRQKDRERQIDRRRETQKWIQKYRERNKKEMEAERWTDRDIEIQRETETERDTMTEQDPTPTSESPDLSKMFTPTPCQLHPQARAPPMRADTLPMPRGGAWALTLWPSPQGSPCTKILPRELALPAALAAKHMYWPESTPVRLSRMRAHEPSGSSMRM